MYMLQWFYQITYSFTFVFYHTLETHMRLLFYYLVLVVNISSVINELFGGS